MSDSTDYDAVNVPDGKPCEEYSYVERRADILERIERAGHPNALNKSGLAREYGVSHTSIGRDFDAIAEYTKLLGVGRLDAIRSVVTSLRSVTTTARSGRATATGRGDEESSACDGWAGRPVASSRPLAMLVTGGSLGPSERLQSFTAW